MRILNIGAMLGVCFVAACGVFTGNPAVDFSPTTIQNNLTTFAAWQSTVIADANKDVSVIVAGSALAACPLVGVLNADLNAAALVSSKVQAVQAQSNAAAAAVAASPICTNPASVTDVPSALATVAATAVQLQTAIKSDPAVVTPLPATPVSAPAT